MKRLVAAASVLALALATEAAAQDTQAPPEAPIASAIAQDVATGVEPIAATPDVAISPSATIQQAMTRPAPSRVRPAINTDEGGLWGMSDRTEQEARNSGQLENDAALNAYLYEVACRVAADACGDIRLYVMNRPYFNASMAPNGYTEVWSGLLLRVEDEAQLAFVLGHEIGHYRERHSLAMLRTIRSRAGVAMVFSIITVGAGVGIIGDIVYLGTIASVFGFSRENESEADMIGFDHAVAAGYDAHAGDLLWKNLLAETQASDNPDVRRQETRGSIFRTHPLSADRVEALEERAAAATGGETHRERYRAAIRPFLARGGSRGLGASPHADHSRGPWLRAGRGHRTRNRLRLACCWHRRRFRRPRGQDRDFSRRRWRVAVAAVGRFGRCPRPAFHGPPDQCGGSRADRVGYAPGCAEPGHAGSARSRRPDRSECAPRTARSQGRAASERGHPGRRGTGRSQPTPHGAR